MKLEQGKFYKNGYGTKLGPADLKDPLRRHYRLADTSTGNSYWFGEDGRFIGGAPGSKNHLVSEYTEDLVFTMKRAVFAEHAGEPTKPASEKQIYEMELDDYRRGIDAIWHNRHLGV